MRDIKFRFWSVLEKTMYTGASAGDVTDYFYARRMLIKLKTPCYNDDLVIWMLYSTLKDKEGKEIYEGDILEIPVLIGEGKTASTYYVSVIFESGCFMMELIDKKSALSPGCLHEVNHRALVIGNIYQNPELLIKKE